MSNEPCDGCGESVADALARTVRLSVDRSNIDTQRLCPECFAQWITHYQNEMSSGVTASPTAGESHSTGSQAGGQAGDQSTEQDVEVEAEPVEEEDDTTDIIVD